METLHAPWRIQYILGPKPPASDASIFTQIAQSNDDVTNHVVARGKTCFALLNNFPYNAGHLLVLPYKQTPDFENLNDQELLELMTLVRRSQNALTRAMRPDGFNIGVNLGEVAGAGIVGHLHIHIVPRWNGDTNFMPVTGATAVLPEALLETAAKIRAALAE